MDDDMNTDTRDFWESFYGEREQVWSGRPNPLLVREAEPLTPGTALDLGCAEGADAIWLAERGWRVTAVDISRTALARAAAHAASAGVEGIEWVSHDLAATFPDGQFDLVSAQFFHSPVAGDGEREKILRRAADAVAPGGNLLVAGHAGAPSWHDADHDVQFPTTADVLDALDLDPARWRVETREVVEREMSGPDGQPGHRKDNVVRVRRLD
jgi:SAM-dependent methyltransferase